MKALRDDIDIDRYFEDLRKANKRVLFLDYDGTLAPFRVKRDDATPYEGVTEILDSIVQRSETRLVLISGRRTKDLVPLLRLKKLPEIWGSHGWERLLPDQRNEIFPLDDALVRGLEEADDWVVAERLEKRCERKPASLALHWRGLQPTSIGRLRKKATRSWDPIASRTGLEMEEFNGGIELRAPGKNKGLAVEQVLSEMKGRVQSAYLGDDRTDEDAFRALRNRGLRVLVRKELRATSADLWLRPPGELLEFLRKWVQACQ